MVFPRAPEAAARQMVSFNFYRLLPEVRRLPPEARRAIIKEVGSLLEEHAHRLILRTYALQGFRAGTDFMTWAIASRLDELHSLTSSLYRSSIGGYLDMPHAFLSMTRQPTYVDRLADPIQEGRRDVISPGQHRYLFVHPYARTRAWYALEREMRQVLMDDHIAVGHRFPAVTPHTTYSFGLDDQEFVLAFETDRPEDFLDLVMTLRATKEGQYTLRDTPVFTCLSMPAWELLEELLGFA